MIEADRDIGQPVGGLLKVLPTATTFRPWRAGQATGGRWVSSGKRKCIAKTKKGNVYEDYIAAENAAALMNQHLTSGRIRAFKCSICGKYHLGRKTPREFWHRNNRDDTRKR